MSTVTYPLYIDPMEIADYLHELLSQNAGPLGLAYVGTGDSLIPEYPAAIVSPGGKAKEIHTTRKFNVSIDTFITIYHARLTARRRTRLREDLDLVASIEGLIEDDYEFKSINPEKQVVFGFVSDIRPGMLMNPKGEQTIGTRMVVNVVTQQMFGRRAYES